MKSLIDIQRESGQLWLDINAQLNAAEAAHADATAASAATHLAALATMTDEHTAASQAAAEIAADELSASGIYAAGLSDLLATRTAERDALTASLASHQAISAEVIPLARTAVTELYEAIMSGDLNRAEAGLPALLAVLATAAISPDERERTRLQAEADKLATQRAGMLAKIAALTP